MSRAGDKPRPVASPGGPGRLCDPRIPEFRFMINSLKAPARPGGFFVSLCIGGYQTGGRAALMRINIWIVLVVLIALLAVTRLLQYQKETKRHLRR